MQFLQRLIENFIKEHVRRKRLYRVVSVLACIVVFVTTYAMILPAITLDRATAEEQPGIETEAGSDPALSGEVNDGTDAEDPEPAEPPEESVTVILWKHFPSLESKISRFSRLEPHIHSQSL